MATPSMEVIRERVASAYPGASWQYRVYHQMKDNQILALYFKFMQDGTFDKAKERKKIAKANEKEEAKQITIFDWIKEKCHG